MQTNWLVLTATLPTRPSGLRVRVWRGLKATGAGTLREGVYVLPEHAASAPMLWDLERAIADAGADAHMLVVKARDASLDKEFEYLVYDLGKGVELRLVKISARGKTFTIGSPNGEKYRDDDENQRDITLSDDYYIGKFEVTRGQFRLFVDETGYKTEAEQGDGGTGALGRVGDVEQCLGGGLHGLPGCIAAGCDSGKHRIGIQAKALVGLPAGLTHVRAEV